MNNQQLAAFLASCTTPGFRRSLRHNPQHTLLRCGFSFPEAAALAAALAALKTRKQGGSHSTHTNSLQEVAFTFSKIKIENIPSEWTATDDWDT
jgi:hypothetical protein